MVGTCKLCRRGGVGLLRSHFIPAGAYRAIHSSMGQAAVVIKRTVTIKKDEQTTDHVLCTNCEQRLSNCGEAYTLSHCYRPENGFRLKEIVDGLTPLEKTESMSFYSARDVAEIDVEKLVHFSAGLLWKGSAHGWRSGKDRIQSPHLGPYEEDLRRYPVGESGFPEHAAVWISIAKDPALWVTVTPPYGEKISAGGESCWRYKILLLGLSFMFFVGRRIDPIILRSCSYRSPEKFILVGDKTNEMIISDLGKTIVKSRPVGSLRRP